MRIEVLLEMEILESLRNIVIDGSPDFAHELNAEDEVTAERLPLVNLRPRPICLLSPYLSAVAVHSDTTFQFRHCLEKDGIRKQMTKVIWR